MLYYAFYVIIGNTNDMNANFSTDPWKHRALVILKKNTCIVVCLRETSSYYLVSCSLLSLVSPMCNRSHMENKTVRLTKGELSAESQERNYDPAKQHKCALTVSHRLCGNRLQLILTAVDNPTF
jgi:hypothetical protein